MDTAGTPLWDAPFATRPLDFDLTVPGSKSMTNRALLLAALASGPSVLRGVLRARDTDLMADALRSLGVRLEEVDDGAPTRSSADLRITPATLRGPATVDCGLAGTVMRFVPAVAALADGDVTFQGDPYASKRPIGALLDALRGLGARIDDEGRGALPFVVRGTGAMAGGEVEIDASASSQFVSALLLAGARYDKGVTVHHVGKPVPSLPHIEMTIAMLRARGVDVDDGEPNTWRVAPGPIAPLDETVEPDLSNAAPFLAGAMVTGGRLRMLRWPEHSTQPGTALREIFASMGGHVRQDDGSLTVRGPGGNILRPDRADRADRLVGIDLDLHDAGELTPVVAAVCALAEGPSYLRGIAHLRFHETDRLAALATELNRLGGDVRELDDGLEIRPKPLRGGVFRTYDDHRMAQAAVVLGLVVRGIQVENIETTGKTMPDFAEFWAGMPW